MTLPLELQVLVASGFLHYGLAQFAGFGKVTAAGPGWGMGNRDKLEQPEFPAWVRRTEMAQRNLGESLPLFTILVLTAILSGQTGRQTELGSWLFLGGRLAHAGTFILGIPGLRTVAYFVAVAGMVLVAASLI